MSKSRALAGLRVGYGIGDRDLIEALTRVKDRFNSYPLGRPAQAGAIASLEDEVWFQSAREQVIESRERLSRGLVRLGFEVLPSSANFVFARHPDTIDGARIGGRASRSARGDRAVFRPRLASPIICDHRCTDAQIDRLLSSDRWLEIFGNRPAGSVLIARRLRYLTGPRVAAL